VDEVEVVEDWMIVSAQISRCRLEETHRQHW
jgi:hypothetical protein